MSISVPWVLPDSETDPCCCPPEECCLYPWPDPNGDVDGPLYPPEDLPDTIVIVGYGTLTRNPGTYTYGTMSFSSTFVVAGGLSVVIDGDPVEFPFNEWVMWQAGWDSYALHLCLISPDFYIGVEDEFPDTLYLHDSTVGATAELSRIDLCCWDGILTYINEFDEEVDVDILICYYSENPGVEIFPDGWPGKPCWILDYGVTGLGPYYSKEDPQKSPEGDYSFGRDGSLVLNSTP